MKDPVVEACKWHTGEYKRVLSYMGLRGQIMSVALSLFRVEGINDIMTLAAKVEGIVGFEPGELTYKFRKGLRGGLAAPWLNEITLGHQSSLGIIVHEMTHIVADKDTTIPPDYWNGTRKNRSVHNQGFAEYLFAMMENVWEHREEMGIREVTLNEIMEHTVKPYYPAPVLPSCVEDRGIEFLKANKLRTRGF